MSPGDESGPRLSTGAQETSHYDEALSTVIVDGTADTTTSALSADEAERLTRRITVEIDAMADAYESVMPLIREAIERDAATALGYSGLPEYVTDRFGGALGRLGIETRREVVRELTAGGMSTRAIAPVVGASKSQVDRDRRGVPPGTPEAEATPPPSPALPPGPQPDSPKVVGLDGKRYSRPAPRPGPEPAPARDHRPLLDGFRDAASDLEKITARIERLVSDDRYPDNREQIAPSVNRFLRARDALQVVIDRVTRPCQICHHTMILIEAGQTTHPSCDPIPTGRRGQAGRVGALRRSGG